MPTAKDALPLTTTGSPGKTCTISMDEEYELCVGQLNAHVPYRLKTKKWRWPKMDFLRYNNNELSLKISSESESFFLTLNFYKQHMGVSCSCQTAEDGRLCLHAYKLLQRLVLHRYCFFSKFRPGGEVDFALAHKRYFSVRWEYDDLRIRKKNFTGKLYVPCKEPSLSQFEQAVQRAGSKKEIGRQSDLVVCYFLLESRRKIILPFIVPCLGTLNKAGTAIKGFHQFLSGTQREYDHLLTEDQRVLNLLCLQLYKAAEALPGTLLDNEKPIEEEKFQQWIKLWKQGISFLQNQPFVFHCPLWWQRELKGKPVKSHVRKIKCCSDEPTIGFTLIQKEEIALLQLTAREPQGRPFKKFDTDLPFFIQADDTFYFLSSLKDAAIAEWMEEEGPVITVFKEHYRQFEKEILQPLKQYYKIDIRQRK